MHVVTSRNALGWALFACLIVVGCQTSMMVVGKSQATSGFANGQVVTYDLDFDSHSVARMQGIAQALSGGETSQYDAHFEGSVKLKENANGRELLVQIQPRNLKLTDRSGSYETATARLAKEIQVPILVEQDASGKVQSCEFQADITPPTRQLGRTIVGLLQFSKPDKPSSRSWEATLDDTIGTRGVRYSISDRTSRRSHITMVFGAYVDHVDPKEIPNSVGSAKLTVTDGRITDINGQITNESKSDADNYSKSTLTFKAKSKGIEKLNQPQNDDALVASLQREPKIPLWAKPTEDVNRRDLAKQTLGGTTDETILRDLDLVTDDPSSPVLSTDQMLKLQALITLRTETCREMTTRLTQAKIDGPRYNAIIGAMLGAGTDSTQAAVASYLTANLGNTRVIRRLIPEMASIVTPSTATVATFKTLIEDTRNPGVSQLSTMAIGGTAKNLRSSNPKTADEIIDFLTARLDQASGDQSRLIIIAGLGNAGTPRVIPPLAKYLASADPKLRGASLTSLRFVDGNEGEAPILSSIRSDSNPDVRIKALFALGFRTPNERTLAALMVAVKTDKVDHVRKAALEQLWTMRDQFPVVFDIVQGIANTDPSEDIRKRSHELLNGDKPRPKQKSS
jgi:hypothetical protein